MLRTSGSLPRAHVTTVPLVVGLVTVWDGWSQLREDGALAVALGLCLVEMWSEREKKSVGVCYVFRVSASLNSSPRICVGC